MTRSKTDSPLPQAVVDLLADALQPAELGVQRRDRMRQRVLQQTRDSAVAGIRTLRGADAIWVEIAPLVEARELSRDTRSGVHVSLMRMRPGGVIPPHRHSKEEQFIVLEGECHIGTQKLCAGDALVAAAGSTHGAVTTEHGVLVLLRGEYPYPEHI